MTADDGAKRRKPVFYGWYIVATCIFVAFVTNGARNSFGIFVLPMSEEFEWSRGTISFAAALGFLVNGITQPFMGQLLDRFGGRKIIVASIAVFGVATVALSLTFHYLFLIFMFGVVSSIALSGMSLNNTGTLLSRWFRRRRATVVGLNASGLSAGGLLLVPLGMYLLQSTNWRITWVAFGVAVLALSGAAGILLPEGRPEGHGAEPGRRRRTGGHIFRFRLKPDSGDAGHGPVGAVLPLHAHLADDHCLLCLRIYHRGAVGPLSSLRRTRWA